MSSQALSAIAATVLAAAAILTAGSGCEATRAAFIDQNVDLVYHSSGKIASPDRMGAAYVARPNIEKLPRHQNGKVLIGPVRRLGGKHEADATANTPVDKWIALALKTELEAAGYQVKLTETLPDKVVRGIEIVADRVLSDSAIGYVELQFFVVRNGTKNPAIPVKGKYNRPGNRYLLSPLERVETLDGALQDCLNQAVPLIAAEWME